jgi:hypothetical protein
MPTVRARGIGTLLDQLESCLSLLGHRLVLGFALEVRNPTKPQEPTVASLWTALRCEKFRAAHRLE